MKSTDWIGHKQGRLTITAFDGIKQFEGKGRACYFTFRCECGKEFSAQKSNVIGKRYDCGCSRPTPRWTAPSGSWNHPLHKAWASMIERCSNANSKSYPDYGGRGIRVCDRWLTGDGNRTGFECFILDMGPRPPRYTIERDDYNGDYTPGNCRWITKSEQGKNARGVRQITIGGVTKTLPDWCLETGIKYFTAHARIKRGWPPDRAISTPTRQ